MTRYHRVGDSLAQARREKSVREWRDIERQEIAEAVGVTATAYGRWERGERMPSREDLDRLADYFGTTPKDLQYREVLPGEPLSVSAAARTPEPEGTERSPVPGVARRPRKPISDLTEKKPATPKQSGRKR